MTASDRTWSRALAAACALGACIAGAAGAVPGGDELPVPAIGAKIGAFTFTDTRWLPRTLDDFGQPAAIVIAFTALDCPVAARTFARLSEFEARFRARGVQFLGIDVGPGDELIEVAARAVEQGLEFPMALDFEGEARRALAPTRTPEIVVLDARRTLRYRGRLDAGDRLGGASGAAVRADLGLALEDVLAGRDVAVSTTPVDGCRITVPERDGDPARVPLFATDVAPILHARCVACHVVGGSAPFELVTYAGAARHAAMIAETVEQGRMPPWHASARYGDFANARRLDARERRTILDWARHAAPPGDLAQAPAPAVSASGWRIGEPDLVVRMTAPVKLPATGIVPYQYVVLPHLFLRDTWVEAVEIRPTNPRALHHANLGYYRFGGDVKSANFITGEVPGGDPLDLGPGTAVKIPAGAVIGLQCHYVTTGEETEDLISVGLRFPRDVVRRELRHHEIMTTRFAIPPGAPAHAVKAKRTFDADAIGIGMFVHMHLRGRDMRFTARPPDGRDETLLLVPSYDFNWQMSYRWRPGARHFPKGTTVECLAHFDNSRFNPWNPDPAKTVTFGQETTDEMMYGFLFYVRADEDLALRVDPKSGATLTR